MLEQLTPEQEAQIDVYRDKWIDIGLSTEPLDFDRAKAAMIKAYAAAGLVAPDKFLVADSPMHAIKMVREIDPSQTASDVISSMIYGSHDASWLSYYDYFREVCDIRECDPLEGLIELAKSSGWACVYDEMVVLQHRPVKILMDDQKRLHGENGPAIEYRDGYAIYSWHGVRIPAEWIENKSALTAEIALTWANIEQRRAACEILGWANILKTLNATVIEADEDPEIGTLVEVEIPEIGREKFLRVRCGTGREFALPVPPDMKTALQANAWTFGMDDASEFVIPEVRT
jgi:hypothetical protein